MSARLPPLNPLRAFEAAARRGSVSAAARELNVTHGAISHQIRALEATFDAPLFERGGKRLKLTPQGALLLPAVTNAFDSIAAATALMTRPTTSGALRISCVSALLSHWMLPRLNEFSEQFPEISLSLEAANDPNRIRSPDLDVCVLYGDGQWSDCWIRRWSNLELFPVVSPSLLNSRPLRSIRDLRDHTLLHGDDGREWNTWLAAADILDMPRGRQHYMSDARLSTEAAIHGQGVALGDTITASHLLARGELTIPFDLAVPAQDAFYVACRNEVRAAPIVKVFVDWLFATLENDRIAEPQASARHILRGKGSRTGDAPPSLPDDGAASPTKSKPRKSAPVRRKIATQNS
ncbi:transcriptional regulator GcvA [Rhizobiaceae bacterium n13]|uniref:Transcriptional regulator GcvA n=1 Tax=Ferirhizobium litorale TaxID=2927786 RepID=A0AAE3U2Y3_9HYPH|nr:transcriptional regulator GcvA [Fererhizobium litorale]MDI7861880.1 transcriptional regulator GcvA [Fererhizobium litorale]MDI7921778.1 transcriptional regulator GcvA [Fererhizobium litorale]